MTADTDNPLVMEVLTASSTAYSYYPDVKISEVCKSVSLVAELSLRKRFGCRQATPLSHLMSLIIIINNICINVGNTCIQPKLHAVRVSHSRLSLQYRHKPSTPTENPCTSATETRISLSQNMTTNVQQGRLLIKVF